MTLQGLRKADRAEVVERDRFATPNPLKSHGERNLFSPGSNSCAIVGHVFEAEVLRKSPGYEIEITCDTQLVTPHRLTYPFPRFPPLEVCGRRAPSAWRPRHGPASENLHKT